jgi:EF hand
LLRFFAGVASCFLLMTGAFLLWQSHAAHAPLFPDPPAARSASLFGGSEPLQAPEASEKSRAEKRFSRYDKNKDGKIEADEYLAARRRNFDKLDLDHNGALSFQEYAAKGIEKFNAADHDRTGWLTEAELATTAPPPSKRRAACSCSRAAPSPVVAENGDDGGN